MTIRQAQASERAQIFETGYKEWAKGRTYAAYCADNAKEDAYGTRWILEIDGTRVSSLILLEFEAIKGMDVFGIGSVVTEGAYRGNGYAARLLDAVIAKVEKTTKCAMVILHSGIGTPFYRAHGFEAMPANFQHHEDSICMVRYIGASDEVIAALLPEELPPYF